MKSSLNTFVAAGVALSLSTIAHAAVIADYRFSSNLVSSDTEGNSTAGNVSLGSGLSAQTPIYSTVGVGSPASSLRIDTSNTGSTESGAVSGSDYFEFTITPSSGYELDLTSLTFATGLSDVFSATWFVRSSVDSYVGNLGSFTQSTTAFESRVVSLGSPAFQNLQTPITFRVYLYESASGTRNMRTDNVVLNGEVSLVPEPAALGSLLAGGAFLLRRTRRSC